MYKIYLNTHVTIILVEITWTLCYSNYDIFQGFDVDQSTLITNYATDEKLTTETTFSTSEPHITSFSSSINDNATISENSTISIATTLKTNIIPKDNCPEEFPTNIGTYEVPTGKDVVMFTQELLLSMFDSYERNAMSLLRDMKEVTKSAASNENKCINNKQAYKQCVKRISSQSETVTKNLVNTLEIKKSEIKTLADYSICTLLEMKTDPMQLIKLLAQETVMLKFALPGFLRLLSTCSAHCLKSQATAYAKKPLRRMTDQELVVKYFLTNKNYIELIKDSRRSV